VQQVAAQLPWGHQVRILDTLKDAKHREWYIRQAIQNGWSRNVLVHQIEGKLFDRQGHALTNFDRTLPAPQSELAQQLIKDPYNFDFLTLGPEVLERDLERSLIQHVRDFILELGKGFAFAGSQYHLEIGGQDYFLDLLFYHLRLRCYVAIDLKIEGEFAMDEMESLSHTRWECKYHVVFIPKCRRKVLYGELRRYLGEVFRKLAEQKESRIEEGHLNFREVCASIA